MLSGGLDSLGTLYKVLTEDAYSNYTVHIHHINIYNIENRFAAEKTAVTNILSTLNDLEFYYEYSESSITIPAYNNHFMFDTDALNFFAGYICSVNPDIEIVAMGMTASDDNLIASDRLNRANNLLSAFVNVKKIYPVLNMTKKQIYALLPEQLKTKFWSCRQPVYTMNTAIYCGVCKTCQQLQKEDVTITNLILPPPL